MQSEGLNKLYQYCDGHVPKKVLDKKNKEKSWEYGFNQEHDMVIISKTGQIGDVLEIKNLKIALPKSPKKIHSRGKIKSEQYWEPEEYPKELQKIKSIFQWHQAPHSFKNKWIDYIESNFEKREQGFWFKNNGENTYITGSHWMYVQWTKIDIGLPNYRDANRIFYYHWEACKADKRSYGQDYVKIRRSGFSYMASEETANIGTISKDARLGILSKTGADAKKMFTDKVVPIVNNYPFFFKPIQDGMDKPKTELAFRVPASKISKKNMFNEEQDEVEGLDTSIDWRNTGDNSYDGEKLLLLVHDESKKWEKPNNIKNNWRVTKTCLRLGRRIIGKCMMGSTVNAMSKGGAAGKKIYFDSNVLERNANGQTKSGLYSLFIAMEYNMEGFIDRFGMPVLHNPEKPILGIDGEWITQGAIDYWEAEAESLKDDPDALNEFYRQFPRTESHAFRDESKNTLFNLNHIYEQVDYNDSFAIKSLITTGNFHWKNGVRDTEVIFTPNNRGNFKLSWIPPKELMNNVIIRNNKFFPGNSHIGSFGGDSYDISGVVGGGGSKGSITGQTKSHMEDAPVNAFFCQYISRPPTAELFYEDVLMALHFYGMPILLENNKPRILYYLKDRGYRGFSINRPDKPRNKLSRAEKELGGIPSSVPVITAHAEGLEAYIEEHVGMNKDEDSIDYGTCGDMYFNDILMDWANYDINNRTKYDATVSSGFAIMANQGKVKKTSEKDKGIILNFAKYRNKGFVSEIIK